MTTSSIRRSLATTGGAGVIAAAIAFTPGWEGMDRVARRDPIGTGHPVTYCYGQTAEFGEVKIGTTFNKQQCDEALAKSLPKYLDEIDKCIDVDMPDKTKAALLDAAYNAGSGAVCRSPMVRKMNAGDLAAGCDAFDMWYVRSDGQQHRGLVARRAGEEHGDPRKSERALCHEGLTEAKLVKVESPLRQVAPLPLPPVQTCVPTPASTPVIKDVVALPLSKQCLQVWNVVTQKEIKLCR